MEFNHRLPTLLEIAYAVLIGVFAYLAGSAYFGSLPGAAPDSFRIAVYSLTSFAIMLYALLKGQAAALRYAVWGLVWGMGIYLFTLRHSPLFLSSYISLRNVYLAGFVALFVVHGILIMLFQSRYKVTAEDLQKNIPHLIPAVIVVVFMYAIINLVSRVI